VLVDEELRIAAVEAGADVDAAAHRDDHALEVQLPFLQRIAGGGLSVLPVAVGGHTTDTIAPLVSRLAETALIVVSTDLSHYLDDTEAQRRDRRTAERVTALDHREIGDHDACGASALRALLASAHDADWHCELLELRTSADAGAGTTSVVGYGAFALTSGSGARIQA
jgi:hypothetical protein